MTAAIPTATFTEAWADCKRLLRPGWDLQLIVRSTGFCLALVSNGATRRWAHGDDEVTALEALESLLLAELAEDVR